MCSLFLFVFFVHNDDYFMLEATAFNQKVDCEYCNKALSIEKRQEYNMAAERCWWCNQNHWNNPCKLLFGKQLLLHISPNQSQFYQSEQQQHPRKVSLRGSAGYKTPSTPPFKLPTQTHKQGHNTPLSKMCISPCGGLNIRIVGFTLLSPLSSHFHLANSPT